LSAKRKRWGGRSGAVLILGVIGACFVLAGSLLSYRAFVESRYIEVIGRSLAAELREEATRLSGSSTTSRHWKLFVTYEYWVGGEHFTSDRVASRRPSLNTSSGQPPSPDLQAMLKLYEPGKDIKVYVSPTHPEQSILIKAAFGGFWLLLVGTVAIGASLAIAYRLF